MSEQQNMTGKADCSLETLALAYERFCNELPKQVEWVAQNIVRDPSGSPDAATMDRAFYQPALRHLHRLEAAVAELDEILPAQAKDLGPADPRETLPLSYWRLACAYMGQGMVEEAQQALARSREAGTVAPGAFEPAYEDTGSMVLQRFDNELRLALIEAGDADAYRELDGLEREAAGEAGPDNEQGLVDKAGRLAAFLEGRDQLAPYAEFARLLHEALREAHQRGESEDGAHGGPGLLLSDEQIARLREAEKQAGILVLWG